MTDEHRAWKRQGEAFWRAHHEAWKRSDLNQRHYCEVHGLPQKAFENWRQKFRAEPQPPERRLLYRRRPLSPPLSPPVSPPLGPVTYPSSQLAGPIVPRPREGHRRRFTTAKLNNVEPFAYLRDVLERLSNGHAMSRIDDLLRWNWVPASPQRPDHVSEMDAYEFSRSTADSDDRRAADNERIFAVF